MGDTRLHAEFPPSSMERLFKCPGSWRLCKDLPSRDSAASIHGTECHAHVAEAINGTLPTSDLTEEERKAYDFRWKLALGDDAKVETELRVAYRTFSGELYFGTTDMAITRADGSVAIVDWKFGRNPVAAPANWQLAAYAVALNQMRHPKKIDAYIFQPNVSDEPAVWNDVPTSEYLPMILELIARCKDDAAPLCPGDHCQFCPAYQDASCPAIRTCAVAMGLAVTRKSPLDIGELATASEERLASWMDAAKLVRKFLDALEDEVKRRARGNGSCAGYKIRKSKGRLAIKDNAELLRCLSSACGEVPVMAFLEAATFSTSKVVSFARSLAPDKETAREWGAMAEVACEACGERGADTETLVRE